MNLNLKYNREDYKSFLKGFLPDFKSDEREVKFVNTSVAKNVVYLGKDEELDIELFELMHESSHDPRVSLATDGFKIMKQRGQHRALIVYATPNSQDWRLSLMTMDPKVNEKGKIGVDFSNPKRYSYFLGENAKTTTPQRFLIKNGKVKDFDDLKSRFAIEVVDKEFFNSYKQLFLQLNEHLLEDHAFKIFAEKQGIKTEIFAKKLLGQIVFIYFLQRKGWLGAKKNEAINQGDSHFLRNQLAKCISNGKNYYNDCLEHLFYDCLNKKPDKAASFYRAHFDCQIPFLNGGLFEPINNYDWEQEFLNIPNEIFSDNPEHPEKGKGILDIFDLYNFTVDENTPDDQEVSVDPEMLGKVFENLLETNIRKGSGSYYTPREIVHYMCKESLINYLTSNVDISEDKARMIITRDFAINFEDVQKAISTKTDIPNKSLAFWEGDAEELSNLLKCIKIVDPACGSGAFLVGMLQQIVMARSLMQEFTDEDYSDYDLKKQTIQNCIYGVDIDPGAIDIAKLRLWLSLVVDHEIEDIEPLPNLDYKVMQGNSLLEDLVVGDSVIPLKFNGTNKLDGRTKEMKNLFEEEKQGKLLLDKSETLADKLEKYHNQYFLINDPQEKKILKKKIDDIEDQLIQSKCNEELTRLKEQAANPANSKKIPKITEQQLAIQGTLNQWKKDHLRPFFPWKLHFGDVFNERAGFDIVIANPPYIDSESMVNSGQENVRNAIQNTYFFTRGNWDIYIAFFELAYNLLNQLGTEVFITPDKWLSKPFGEALRTQTVKNLYMLVSAGRDVFEGSKVDSVISFFSKNSTSNLKILEFNKQQFLIKKIIKKSVLKIPYAFDWLFSDYLELLMKIDQQPKELSNYGVCKNACATSDAYKLKPYIEELKGNYSKKYLKIINTGTIGKFYSRWGTREMTYLGLKYLKPIIDRKKFLETFTNSYGNKSILPKIILKGLNLLDACLDIEGDIVPGKSTLIITSKNTEYLKCLLAIINSKFAFFYLKEKYISSSYNQGISYSKDMINHLPLFIIDEDIVQRFNVIVDAILKIVATDDYALNQLKQKQVQEYQKKVDEIIYDFYGITKKEVQIIEENIK